MEELNINKGIKIMNLKLYKDKSYNLRVAFLPLMSYES